MKRTLIIAFFVISVSAQAQSIKKDLTIRVEAQCSVNDSQYIINVSRTSHTVKIVYQVRDSICYTAMKKDKRYETYRQLFFSEMAKNPRNDDSLKATVNKLKQITWQYSKYSCDSILLKNSANAPYIKMLDSIYIATDAELAGKKHFGFDGTNFEFTIRSANTTRLAYAWNPIPSSQPLLSSLLRQSFAVYRTAKPNSEFPLPVEPKEVGLILKPGK